MKPLPRLLPIVAVAMGGVLALKALSGVQALPAMFSPATAQAEEAPKAASAKGAAAAKAAPLPAAVAPKPPPACVISPAELARQAGLSPGELQTLQNLQTRRGQLDDRERTLDTQIQLLAAAETKVDAKLKAMNAVKAQIQVLLGQADQQQQSDVDRLVLVYQKMKPADAAAIMSTLDDKVRVPVAAKMKDAALAAILGKMPTVEAKKLTESLAQRGQAAKAAIKAVEQAPVEAAAAAPTPSADPTAPTPAPVKAKGKARAKKLASATHKTPHAADADAAVPGTPADKAPPAKATAVAPAKKPAPAAAAPSTTG